MQRKWYSAVLPLYEVQADGPAVFGDSRAVYGEAWRSELKIPRQQWEASGRPTEITVAWIPGNDRFLLTGVEEDENATDSAS